MSESAFDPLGAVPGIVDQIADEIRKKIADGTFPPGSHFADALIAGQMQVSRGPVREALQRLIQEGLLRNVRHRGVFVSELEPSDIEDIALARLAVDRLAAGRLAETRDPDVFKRLQLVVHEMGVRARENDWAGLIDLDLQFHEILIGSLHSRRLTTFYHTLVVETRMSLSQLKKYYPHQYEIADEHQLVIDAIGRGDNAELDSVIAKHLDHAGRRADFEASKSVRG